tara:strand:+ start:43676 stop:44743 length:1068 start_codon:yes stop_codon:yes gene_type:complete
MSIPDQSLSEQTLTTRRGLLSRATRSRAGFFLGVALLIGAGVYLFSAPDQIQEFIGHIKSAPLWAAFVVLVGPLVNWIFIGLCLHALMRRHGEVGRSEMLALVGSAWLLNHLPMRPGLIGRIGYHAKVNKIRVRDSIEASIWSMVLAGIANGIALGMMMVVPEDTPIGMVVLYLLIPIAGFGLLTIIGFLRNERLGFLMLGLMYRGGDLLVWMIRYAAAFAILGVTITPIQIALITAVSQIAQLIPITGGGLGFREWGVGLAAQMTSKGSAITMRVAIGADVINRIAETIIVIPLGMICIAMVARRVKVWNAENQREQDGTVCPSGIAHSMDGSVSLGSSKDESGRHSDDEDETR